LKKLELGGALDQYQVARAWEEVVGDSVARRSKVDQLTPDGTLFIQVENPTWRTELHYMHDDLVNRLGEVVGRRVVRRLRFRVRATD